jgi:two-component system OmpR family sensor kinase
MSPGVVDLAALVRAAVAEAEPEAERRRIALLPQVDDSLLPLAADADALNVLLRNLVENALHYTPEGGRVYVGARAAGSPPTGASVAELVVEDSGPGIAPADRQRVLDRFYRVPGAPGHGSGLGLAIVRAIADRHGAKLVLDDSPALGGLRVSVLLNGLRVK